MTDASKPGDGRTVVTGAPHVVPGSERVIDLPGTWSVTRRPVPARPSETPAD